MNYLLKKYAIAATLALCWNWHAAACDSGTVRDAAFHGQRDVYRLGVVFSEEEDGIREQYERLKNWFESVGQELNVELDVIAPEDHMYLKLQYGLQERPEALPISVLSGRHPFKPEPRLYQQWAGMPTVDFLEKLKENPLAMALAEATPTHWAAMVYIRGTGTERRGIVMGVSRQWRSEHPPGVSVIEINRTDPEHAWFRTFADIEDSGEDWAGIVYGRGRLLPPALIGEAITGDKIEELLNKLTVPCTCIQQAETLGIDLPMYWPKSASSMHAPLDPPLGYVEMALEDKLASILEEVPDANQSINTTTITMLIIMAVVIVSVIAIKYIQFRFR